MKVSVIVPVYNTEKYLNKCLDSLVNQTMDDYEVIVVNDGSKDDSESIINEYAKKYSFIKYYKKQNGGLSSARNYGINYASGKYIAFVDSDDSVEKNMLIEMYDTAIKENSDIVICDYYSLENNKKRYINCHMKLADNYRKEYLLSPPMAWIRLIKKEILNKEKFTNGIYYEDLDISPRLLIHAKKISYVEKPLYNYYVREGSIMGQKEFNNKLLDIFTVLENNRIILKKDYFDELEYLYISHLLRTSSLRFLDYPNTKEYLIRINEIMKKEFPNWKKNMYYQKSSKKMKVICYLAFHKWYFILRVIKKIAGRR